MELPLYGEFFSKERIIARYSLMFVRNLRFVNGYFVAGPRDGRLSFASFGILVGGIAKRS